MATKKRAGQYSKGAAHGEAVRAGLAHARAMGRPVGRPKLDSRTRKAIARALKAGDGIRPTARKYGVGVGTVQRIKAEIEAQR